MGYGQIHLLDLAPKGGRVHAREPRLVLACRYDFPRFEVSKLQRGPQLRLECCLQIGEPPNSTQFDLLVEEAPDLVNAGAVWNRNLFGAVLYDAVERQVFAYFLFEDEGVGAAL
ncbi:hypothetical protein SBV1_3740002 [Verrucomicrobia bacterium]|nr:hypothetical protein SBV1_3740002 [Verrucomicrobiota bacterium]